MEPLDVFMLYSTGIGEDTPIGVWKRIRTQEFHLWKQRFGWWKLQDWDSHFTMMNVWMSDEGGMTERQIEAFATICDNRFTLVEMQDTRVDIQTLLSIVFPALSPFTNNPGVFAVYWEHQLKSVLSSIMELLCVNRVETVGKTINFTLQEKSYTIVHLKSLEWIFRKFIGDFVTLLHVVQYTTEGTVLREYICCLSPEHPPCIINPDMLSL